MITLPTHVTHVTLATFGPPVSIPVPQHFDNSIAALDDLDSRKGLLDVFPKDDMLSIDVVARDDHGICRSSQAKGLIRLHLDSR